MGKTFSQPTYFYQDNTVPDLVDTNGPLYSRTGVNLGNVVPTEIVFRALDMSGDNAVSYPISITSDDLSVVLVPYAKLPGSSGKTLLVAKLYGYIEIYVSPGLGTVSTPYLSGNITFEPFDTGDTHVMPAVGSIAVVDRASNVYASGAYKATADEQISSVYYNTSFIDSRKITTVDKIMFF